MYHISREWNCLPSNKLYTLGCINTERSVVSSMFRNYNLLQSCFSFSTLVLSLLPLNLMLGTLILLEDYQIQILKNLWCTISWGGTRINSLSFSNDEIAQFVFSVFNQKSLFSIIWILRYDFLSSIAIFLSFINSTF